MSNDKSNEFHEFSTNTAIISQEQQRQRISILESKQRRSGRAAAAASVNLASNVPWRLYRSKSLGRKNRWPLQYGRTEVFLEWAWERQTYELPNVLEH